MNSLEDRALGFRVCGVNLRFMPDSCQIHARFARFIQIHARFIQIHFRFIARFIARFAAKPNLLGLA